MKGVIRIGGAAVLGIGIILVALHVGSKSPTQAEEHVATATVRDTAQVAEKNADANNNGIPDWEEVLRDKAFKTITVPTTSPTFPNADTYTPPTTLTGKFSEAFMQDYLEAKMYGGGGVIDPEDFIENAVQSIEASTRSKKYTRAEISTIPADTESIRTYGNELARIMKTHSTQTEPEIVIFEKMLTTGDVTLIEKLAPIRTAYTDILKDAKVLPVPDMLALEHVALLNAYEAIITDIEAMEMVHEDPLYALARVNTYPADIELLTTTLRSLYNLFDARGIVYAQDEPGSFFYIFDAL